MHSGSECSAWINVKDHFVLVLFLHFFPGGNDQDIVHIELMEKFLPVVDPVLVLSLGFGDGALADVHVSAHFLQNAAHSFQNRLHLCILLQIEIQIGNSVICRIFWHNIHKHLLLICLSKRLLVLNLNPLHAYVCKCGNDHILRLCFGFNRKAIPLHIHSPILIVFINLGKAIPVIKSVILFSGQISLPPSYAAALSGRISRKTLPAPEPEPHPQYNAVSEPVWI